MTWHKIDGLKAVAVNLSIKVWAPNFVRSGEDLESQSEDHHVCAAASE